MLLKAALAYAGRSVPVFPCQPSAKRPLTRNGHWDATTDPQAIGRWWKQWPSANIGVPTGKKSGLVVLDVDPDAGGSKSLAKLDGAANVLRSAVSEIGSRYNRITQAKESAMDRLSSVSSQLSDIEDIDLPKTIMEMQLQQTSYQAALAASAKVIQPSLIDFLR